MLWSSIAKRRGHTKINQNIKEDFYNYILYHPQVVQYPIEDYCPYVSIGGNPEIGLTPKLLLKVSVRELHSSIW